MYERKCRRAVAHRMRRRSPHVITHDSVQAKHKRSTHAQKHYTSQGWGARHANHDTTSRRSGLGRGRRERASNTKAQKAELHHELRLYTQDEHRLRRIGLR